MSLAGAAAEMLDQKERRQPLLAPTPCTDGATAEAYLRFATTRGNITNDALDRERRVAEKIIEGQRRAWRAVIESLRQRERLDEGALETLLSSEWNDHVKAPR